MTYAEDWGELHYEPDTVIESVANNGHTVQYNFERGRDYAVVDGTRYDLIQVHFHAPAEHTINGVRYPIELHLVHASTDGDYLVYSVMGEQGPAAPAFEFLGRFLPVAPGETKQVSVAHSFETEADLEQDEVIFVYEGSLTTPPCSERVLWMIFREPLTLAPEQIDQLQALMPADNYRGTQPLNGRVVERAE